MATLSGQTIAASYQDLVKRADTYSQTGTNIEIMDDSAVVKPTGLYLESGATTDSVGIGIAAPSGILHLYKTGSATQIIEGSSNDAQINYISGGVAKFLLGYTSSADGFRFNDTVGTSTAMFIKSNSGNVGIGNTDPGSVLEVSKVSGDAALELSSWSATDTHSGTLIFQKSSIATVNTFGDGSGTAASETLGRIESWGATQDGTAADDIAKLSSYIEFANDAVSREGTVPGKIVFATAPDSDDAVPAVAMTIDDGGDVTVSTGNLIIGAADKGIDFKNSTDNEIGAGSVSAEILDDYEEGSWIPTLTGGLSGTFTGWYTKIGNTVNLWGALASIVWDNSGGTTATVIGGLPFTSTNTAAKKNYFTIAPFKLNTTQTHVVLLGLSYGAVVMDLNETQDNGNHVVVNESAFPTSGGTTLRFNVTYTA